MQVTNEWMRLKEGNLSAVRMSCAKKTRFDGHASATEWLQDQRQGQCFAEPVSAAQLCQNCGCDSLGPCFKAIFRNTNMNSKACLDFWMSGVSKHALPCTQHRCRPVQQDQRVAYLGVGRPACRRGQGGIKRWGKRSRPVSRSLNLIADMHASSTAGLARKHN